LIERLCIIGVGLIGGSLARALKAAGYCGEIVGAGRNKTHLETAVSLGVIDRFDTDLAKAVDGADMVMVAVPLGAMAGIFEVIHGKLNEAAVLTDTGSVKGSVIEDAARVFGACPANFVPGHPIAGTEKSGVEASFTDLYKGRQVILTPHENTDLDATARVCAMWEAAGASVVEMDSIHHDVVLAATSHLPHLLAFALVDSLARLDDSGEVFEFAAGGFHDFTRIASSDPVMWRDICLANGEAVNLLLERYVSDLQALGNAVVQHDGEKLLAIFQSANTARDRNIKD
jgi:prephenate dehydrogenase